MMTFTEDQLRQALTSLEVHAPNMSFATKNRRASPRRRIVLPVASAAGVCAIAATFALTVGGHNTSSENGTLPATGKSAVLRLSVGYYGGPLNPYTGHEAMTGTPIPHTTITITAESGPPILATTDSIGIATVHLKPGTYMVSTRQCGPGAEQRSLTLIAGKITSYEVVCSIP